jgi:predicted HAD superfamily Cof-like phosphohydrolase
MTVLNTSGLRRVARELEVIAEIIDNEGRQRSDFNSVGDFHEKFGLANQTHHQPCAAHEITPELVLFRLRFMLEELIETAEGYGYELGIDGGHGWNSASIIWQRTKAWNDSRIAGDLFQQDLPKIFDGLIDLVYVALGTAQLHHFPWADGFAEVQRANMTKERATRAEQSTRGSTFDVVKPAGWTPPNIIEVLMRNGWQGPRLLDTKP